MWKVIGDIKTNLSAAVNPNKAELINPPLPSFIFQERANLIWI